MITGHALRTKIKSDKNQEKKTLIQQKMYLYKSFK